MLPRCSEYAKNHRRHQDVHCRHLARRRGGQRRREASENRAKRRGAQQRRVDPVILHEPPDPLDDVTVREAHETAKPPLAWSRVATVNLFSKYLLSPFCLKELLYIFA